MTLTLTLSTSTDRLTDRGWTELVLAIDMRNASAGPIDIYPDIAPLSPASGWGSPIWFLELVAAGRTCRLRELHTWYGPPGMPPADSVFQQRRRALGPGESHRHEIVACYIPRDELPGAACSREALDPQGMDAISDAELAAPAILAIKSASFLTKQPPDQMLRPGQLAFLPDRGPLQLSVRYHQEPWFAFKTKHVLDATSNAIAFPTS
jgi:hypothetical protein